MGSAGLMMGLYDGAGDGRESGILCKELRESVEKKIQLRSPEHPSPSQQDWCHGTRKHILTGQRLAAGCQDGRSHAHPGGSVSRSSVEPKPFIP